MSAEFLSERARVLDTVLAGSRDALASAVRSSVDPVELHLRSVPFERITRLTSILKDADMRTADEVDAIAMQLLLTDYAAAVAHLRAVVQMTATNLDAVPVSLKPARRFEARQAKRRAQRLSSVPG
jgi:predicted nucleotidyltransferase